MTTNTGFIAEAEDSALRYSLKPYVEKEGVIPEPSTQQIERLIEFLRQVMPTKQDENNKTVLDISKVAQMFEGQDSAQIETLVNSEIASVTSGEISAEDLTALPYRVKQRFYGWLLGTLLSPEA